MRARWVLYDFTCPDALNVGDAIVASWWPGRYHRVFTYSQDPSNPMTGLLRSIHEYAVATGAATAEQSPKDFVTHICRCSKLGLMKVAASALYKREYSTREDAQAGHRMTVSLLETGRLKLRRVR